MRNDITIILESEEIKKSLKKFYMKTLEQYLDYINKNILVDLN